MQKFQKLQIDSFFTTYNQAVYQLNIICTLIFSSNLFMLSGNSIEAIIPDNACDN